VHLAQPAIVVPDASVVFTQDRAETPVSSRTNPMSLDALSSCARRMITCACSGRSSPWYPTKWAFQHVWYVLSNRR
jgi:hypothetical protein